MIVMVSDDGNSDSGDDGNTDGKVMMVIMLVSGDGNTDGK